MPDEETRCGDVGGPCQRPANEIAVERSDPRCGDVVVHFPRLGYRVRRGQTMPLRRRTVDDLALESRDTLRRISSVCSPSAADDARCHHR